MSQNWHTPEGTQEFVPDTRGVEDDAVVGGREIESGAGRNATGPSLGTEYQRMIIVRNATTAAHGGIRRRESTTIIRCPQRGTTATGPRRSASTYYPALFREITHK